MITKALLSMPCRKTAASFPDSHCNIREIESAMRITDGTEACQACGKTPSIIYCDGCEIPLCRSCRKFDMWQQGCGSIPTKVFCVACAANPWVNPWGSAMD